MVGVNSSPSNAEFFRSYGEFFDSLELCNMAVDCIILTWEIGNNFGDENRVKYNV